MEFVYKNKKGEELGPFSEEAMQKMAETGEINPSTEVKYLMLNKWKKAADLVPLHDHFATLEDDHEEGEEYVAWWGDSFAFKRKEKKKPVVSGSAFKYEFIPNPATAKMRLFAGLVDLILLLVVMIILFFVGALAINNYDKVNDIKYHQEVVYENVTSISVTENSVAPGAHLSVDVRNDRVAYLNDIFYNLFTLLVVIVLLYLGLSLGVFAQTIGMWYFGVLIVKDDVSEVFLLRALAFSVVTIFVGILSPIFALVNPKGIALNEMITNVRVIRISSKPK